MEDGRDRLSMTTAGLTVKRRTVLTSAGVAALAATAPGLGSGRSRAIAATIPAAVLDPTGLPLIGGEEFPIGLWWPPPPFETTVERYQEIKDAGFNFVITGNYIFADAHIQRRALSVAEQVGLKVVVDDDTIRWLSGHFDVSEDGSDFTLTSAQMSTKIKEVLDAYQPTSFWQIQDGRLRQDGGTSGGSIGLSREGAGWSDYRFAFDVAPRQTGGGGAYAQSGWAFRAQDPQNAYVWLLSNFKYTSEGAPGYLAKALFVNGNPAWVRPVALDFPVTADTWYHVETTVEGDTITTSINGQVVDTTTDSTYGEGKVGFREAGDTSSLYDNVEVTDPDGTVLLTEDFSDGLEKWDAPKRGGYSSFVGIDYRDEPPPSKFETTGRMIELGQELAPHMLAYTNMVPTTDPDYIRRFVDVIKPPMLSYDRYPFRADGDDPNYFLNWQLIREEGLRADLPTWCFIQALKFHLRREPTAAEMLWQVNTSLAYGAKGIQYFTYWTPDPARGENFEPAMITVDGQRTERYDAGKEINTTWLAQVGKQLKPLVSESVMHANESPLPEGATGFTPNDYVAAVEGGAVILGQFHAREPSNDRWLLVANRAHSEDTSALIRPARPAVTEVARFDPATEEYVRERNAQRVSIKLGPGEATLLRLGRRSGA